VLHLPPMRDAKKMYALVKREYEKRFGLTILNPSPGNDSQGLAVTQAVAGKYNVRTLSQCARVAPQLRLAAVPEFVARADALPGLQKFYGGLTFTSVRTFDIGLQYEALAHGDADVATAFTTDAQITAKQLVVLEDDRQFWPPYNIVPVVRIDVMKANGAASGFTTALNRMTEELTDAALRRLNFEVDIKKRDPSEVAAEFIY